VAFTIGDSVTDEDGQLTLGIYNSYQEALMLHDRSYSNGLQTLLKPFPTRRLGFTNEKTPPPKPCRPNQTKGIQASHRSAGEWRRASITHPDVQGYGRTADKSPRKPLFNWII